MTNNSAAGLILPREQVAPEAEAVPGLQRQVLVHTSAMMLVRHRMRKGWRGTRHRHPHEQLVYVVSGWIRVRVEDAWCEAAEGDNFIVTSNADHEAEALEDSVVLDIFTPAREDYL